jgi:hypothetical protein
LVFWSFCGVSPDWGVSVCVYTPLHPNPELFTGIPGEAKY